MKPNLFNEVLKGLLIIAAIICCFLIERRLP